MNTLAVSQADLRRMFQAGNVRYLVMGINLLLVIWIAAQLAALTWGVFKPAADEAPVTAVQRSTPLAADPGRQLIARLPDWHLMGVASNKPNTVKTAVPAEAPDTRLRLTLRGALASDEPSGGHAIIADEKGKDERYSIGDTLPGNAELSEIFPDRVILKRGGRFETLRLPESSNLRSTGVAGQRQRIGQVSSPTGRLADVRERLSRNSSNLLNVLTVNPHNNAAGKLLGYRLAPGRKRELFDASGLVEGDIAIRLNDIDLTDAANSGKALQILKSGVTVNVVVLRGGVETNLTLEGT